MNASERQKIEQTISMLQELLGQKPSSGAVGKLKVPGLDQEVTNFTNLSKQLEPEIQELTKSLHGCIDLMQNVISYSTVCKAPNQQEKKGILEKFQVFIKKVDSLFNNANFGIHAKAVNQLISATLWVLSETPQFQIQGGLEAADFHAMKFQLKKVEGHNAWYRSVKKAMKLIEQFSKQYHRGLAFNQKGTVSWADFLSGSVPEVKQKKIEEPQKTQVQTEQAQPKVSAPKPPKMELQGPNWIIANYKNEKIAFPPGKLQMKHGIIIQNCSSCHLEIDEKFKSLQMAKCTNFRLQVKNCVSGVEIMNCNNVQLIVKGQTPSISVDKTEKATITLNEDNLATDIVSSKTSELNIYYEKDEKTSKGYFVGEQVITTWNPASKKFQTKIYDKFM